MRPFARPVAVGGRQRRERRRHALPKFAHLAHRLITLVPRDDRGVDRADRDARDPVEQIGRASCRERVGQYVSISVVAVSLKKKKTNKREVSRKQLSEKSRER